MTFLKFMCEITFEIYHKLYGEPAKPYEAIQVPIALGAHQWEVQVLG